MITLTLSDDSATLSLGAKLAALFQPGDFIALYGGLGAGKTTLSRGAIGALLGRGTEVPSPTYTLVQLYDTPRFTLWHFDLYRIESPDALTELGWQEATDGVSLVEWPERAQTHLPTWRLDVYLSADTPKGKQGRKARLEPHGEDWHKRLHGFAL